MAERHPAAAAMFVLSAMVAMAAGSAAIVLPGLNPNHPSQRIRQPSVAEVMLWPGIGLTWPFGRYLPRRGPSTMTPASAAHPPMLWTTVEPAKSRKPCDASQPPPHAQWPPTG